MNSYYVNYKMHSFSEEKGINVVAKNKADAYETAAYIVIPKEEGMLPYSAWVHSVTYRNGKEIKFNTHEGKAY